MKERMQGQVGLRQTRVGLNHANAEWFVLGDVFCGGRKFSCGKGMC